MSELSRMIDKKGVEKNERSNNYYQKVKLLPSSRSNIWNGKKNTLSVRLLHTVTYVKHVSYLKGVIIV